VLPKQVKSQVVTGKKVKMTCQDPLQEMQMQRAPKEEGLEIFSVSTKEFKRLRQIAEFAV
jgi:hypothetical protein